MEKRRLRMYLDIPFCPVKCRHCARAACQPRPDLRSRYAMALRKEIQASAGSLPEYEVSAIYIGGGIPWHMMDEELGDLLKDMRSWYAIAPDAEITLKVHPGMVGAQTLAACSRGHVTRLSIEYVTGNPFEHEALGRFLNPSAMDITRMMTAGRKLDQSFDVLVGLPGQTRTSFKESLKKAIGYGAVHLCLYPLSLEEGTPLCAEDPGKRQVNPRRRLPEPSETETWLLEAAALLTKSGWREYLPGKWALPGKECRYETQRREGVECLAFGLGAESRLDGICSQNTSDLNRYLRYSASPDQIICRVRPA